MIPPAAFSRRQLLRSTGVGFGSLALAALLAEGSRGAEAAAAEGSAGTDSPGANPLAAKPPHFPARARRVIFLFMKGGPFARRHVRSQAAAGSRRRQAGAVRETAGAVRADRQSAALAVEVPAARPERLRASELFPHLASASTTCA